jgi:hypothetical protein
MKNLEIKNEIKKMSLANIDGKLTPEEMENIMAGSGFWSGCGGATVGLVFAGASLVTLTAASGGLATFLTVGGWLAASSAWGATCGSRR